MTTSAKNAAKRESGAIRYIDRRQIFAEHAFFRGLAAEAIEELASRSRVEHHRRGRTIFRKGSAGRSLMAVLQGAVKICTVSRSGREAVLNVIGPGYVFGEIAVLDGGPRTADAIAGSDCEILVLDRRDLVPVMRASPDFAQRLLEILCGRLRRTSEQLEDVFFLDLAGRLAKTLLGPRAGGANGGDETAMSMTQRELGEMIGTSRESINKQLHKWQREGIVRIAKGKIEVRRRDRLRDLARQL
ncbi:MAG: Crp/Fnr family transcriptional regulator, partial [Alphaproteobacteria bacterium]